MLRGIITTPGKITRSLEGGSVFSNQGMVPGELNACLLYWDKIVVPSNNIYHVSLPNEDDLISCNAITRPRIQVAGHFAPGEIGDTILREQTKLAQLLMRNDQIDWVVQQSGGGFIFAEGDFSVSNSIRMSLNGVLPVPPPDVRVNEILEFKERRSDELGELHDTIDRIYLTVLSAPDSTVAERVEVRALNQAIESLQSSYFEHFEGSTKYNLSISFNVSGNRLMAGAILGAGAAGVLAPELLQGYDVSLPGLVGAVASCLNISLEKSASLEAAKSNMRLGYLTSASEERIV